MAAAPDQGTPSLIRLLDPDVLADPYPLHRQLREQAPVHWDPYLHSWVVTRYADVVTVLSRFSADRTPTPDKLAELGMGELAPIAAVMVRQMLFLDPPSHTRVRTLSHAAFTARRIAHLREHIQQIADRLVDAALERGRLEVMSELANPLPAIVTAEMLGVPSADHTLLKVWSEAFAEMLGNFQHNPGRTAHVLAQVAQMTDYFRDKVRAERDRPTDGLINALVTAEVDGDRFSEDDVIANIIVTMVGGQETTTNLIGNGILTLLRHPDEMRRLIAQPELMGSAVEELLRFESPSQHTARLAPADTRLGGYDIAEGQAVIAVMAAANRDPDRFPDPDRLDLGRTDNRHLAFGWAAHFCFGAPLARMEGAIALETVLRRLPGLALDTDRVVWRPNLGLRGLSALPVAWDGSSRAVPAPPAAAVPAAAEKRRAALDSLTPAQRALLAQRLKGRAHAGPADAVPGPSDGPLPVSAEQRQILLHSLFTPGDPVYNEVATLAHTGALDEAALRRALSSLIARHDSWRSTFARHRRAFDQTVQPAGPLELVVHDLRHVAADERDARAAELIGETGRAPYDLRTGPLLRLMLVHVSDDEQRLYVFMHHVVFDGVSLKRVLLPELSTLYEAEAAGRAVTLPPVVQYSQYAAWQHSALPAQLERHLPFWREHLAGVPVLDLPLHHPRPPENRHLGEMHWFELPAGLVSDLSEFAAANDATLFHAFVAGYVRLLQSWRGQEDLVLSTVAGARQRPEFEAVFGYCITPVPFRLRSPVGRPAGELIAAVRDELLDALSHAVPFERLVEDLAPTPEPGTAPVFQTQIVLEPDAAEPPSPWRLHQLDPRIGQQLPAAKNDLHVELDKRPEGHVVGRFVANADLFDAGFAERAVEQWVEHLHGLLSD